MNAGQSKLLAHAGAMDIHRAGADPQAIADLLRLQPIGSKSEDLQFTRRKAFLRNDGSEGWVLGFRVVLNEVRRNEPFTVRNAQDCRNESFRRRSRINEPAHAHAQSRVDLVHARRTGEEGDPEVGMFGRINWERTRGVEFVQRNFVDEKDIGVQSGGFGPPRLGITRIAQDPQAGIRSQA
jgi:hypothetical protein